MTEWSRLISLSLRRQSSTYDTCITEKLCNSDLGFGHIFVIIILLNDLFKGSQNGITLSADTASDNKDIGIAPTSGILSILAPFQKKFPLKITVTLSPLFMLQKELILPLSLRKKLALSLPKFQEFS